MCRLLDNKTLDILTAAEVIAVNQDPLGVPSDRVWKVGPAEVLPKDFCLTHKPLLVSRNLSVVNSVILRCSASGDTQSEPMCCPTDAQHAALPHTHASDHTHRSVRAWVVQLLCCTGMTYNL